MRSNENRQGDRRRDRHTHTERERQESPIFRFAISASDHDGSVRSGQVRS